MKTNQRKIPLGIAVFPLSAYLCGLRGIWILPSGISLLWMIPAISGNRVRKEEQTKKMQDGIYYMEQMLYSFGKNHKILAALRDTEELCDGALKETVHESAEQLTRGDRGMFRAAFSGIEACYGSSLMKNMHNFLIGVEEQGGEVQTAINLLDIQLNNCKTEEKNFTIRMEGVRKKLILSVYLSCVICAASARLIPSWTSLEDNMVFKLTQALGILALQILYTIFLCIPCPDITEAGILKSPGKRIRRKDMKLRKNDIERAFPVWMYEMLLRLQTESVDSAILHSIETADPVLAEPLYRFYSEITENPVTAEPYKNFLCEYKLEQVRTMMMRLYAISTMGKEEIPGQIGLILKQNQAIKDTADEEHAENLLAAAGFLTAIPMAVSFAVLAVTMSVMMLTVLKTFAISL